MNTGDRFIEKNKEGNTPWVHKEADFNLVNMVENWPINPCRTLELGCGTGTDAIWLAENGFEVTAIDGSPIAIDIAKKAAQENNIDCNFKVIDFVSDEMKESPYDFIFDRGFFHSFDTDSDRKLIAEKAAGLLSERGMWLTLMANADAPPRDSGPPMRSARSIVDAVEPFFKILTLTVSYFGNEQDDPPRIWVCLMRKR
ncbi:MAG: class I SAM-dependent methyltransferase [Bacteroidetes bacterium]|nr:class I SAM-dependent methyltransferase [Bacteroidota bacterium]